MAKMADWRKRNALKLREGHVRKFGLTLDSYDEIWIEQCGVCAICHKPESLKQRACGVPDELTIDHDHETGRVRGLLCRSCNRALGMFKENPAILRDAASYLELSV